MKSKIILVIVLLAALGVLVYAGRPNGETREKPDSSDADAAGAATTTPYYTVDKTLHDFGVISMRDGDVSTTYTLVNTGEEPLAINKLYTSCMCTQALLKVGDKSYGPFGMPGHGAVPTFDAVLAPGESATLEATFDPAAHGPAGIGRIDRVVRLETSAGNIDVGLSATVKP